MNDSTKTTGGITFLSLLAILFIGLKLGGVIDWSWVWVLAPLWIPFAVVFLIFIIIGIFGVICESLND